MTTNGDGEKDLGECLYKNNLWGLEFFKTYTLISTLVIIFGGAIYYFILLVINLDVGFIIGIALFLLMSLMIVATRPFRDESYVFIYQRGLVVHTPGWKGIKRDVMLYRDIINIELDGPRVIVTTPTSRASFMVAGNLLESMPEWRLVLHLSAQLREGRAADIDKIPDFREMPSVNNIFGNTAEAWKAGTLDRLNPCLKKHASNMSVDELANKLMTCSILLEDYLARYRPEDGEYLVWDANDKALASDYYGMNFGDSWLLTSKYLFVGPGLKGRARIKLEDIESVTRMKSPNVMNHKGYKVTYAGKAETITISGSSYFEICLRFFVSDKFDERPSIDELLTNE